MKRPRSKKHNDFEFSVKFGDSSIKFRLQKPGKQTSARLVRWALAILLALLILFMPQLWQAIQIALSVVNK